ncbi:hypothetical protein DRH14_00280 [Candidatus Shapirobacteria bacterium]|nr:MAG: hypothetical protein DRH14_00280 [Candidatus Shapirobacteria bacterium]
MNYHIGQIDKLPAYARGWLCGHFYPSNSLLKTDQLEIKYGHLSPGQTSPNHYHPTGQEMLIFITGKAKMILDGKQYIIKAGDFIFQQAGVHETITQIIEAVTYIAIRTPSVPNNKVFVSSSSSPTTKTKSDTNQPTSTN